MDYKFKWSNVKNYQIKLLRGSSFEEILTGSIVAIEDNINRENQQVIFIWYKEQIWFVPFVEDGEGIFLKTAYPTRKYTKIYLKKGDINENKKN